MINNFIIMKMAATNSGIYLLSIVVRVLADCRGSSQSPGLEPYNVRGGLYINTQLPIQCSGVVVGWNYCYHRVREEHQEQVAVFSVYNDIMLVQGSRLTYRKSGLAQAAFTCDYINLAEANWFNVSSGNKIAVCFTASQVDSDNGINPLSVLSTFKHEYYLQNIEMDCYSNTSYKTATTRKLLNSWSLHLTPDIRELEIIVSFLPSISAL